MLKATVCILFFLEQVFFIGTTAGMPAPVFQQKKNGTLQKIKAPEASYQVALVYSGYDNPLEGYFCAGSLINRQWVLTAAHCLSSHSGISDFRIAVGSAKLSRSRLVPAVEVVRHEAFDRNSMVNDIALIKLADPIQDMQPVDLADFETEHQALRLNTHAFVSGWGSTAYLPKTISDDLLNVGVPIIDRRSCNRSYKGAVTHRMICAGGKDADSCRGDSGGGLVINYKGHKYLEGIVSWGEGCGDRKKPGVYTRIPSYLDWIRAHMH